MPRTFNPNPNPMPTFGGWASTIPIVTPAGKARRRYPVQIAGLLPLICCDGTADDRDVPPVATSPVFSNCDCRLWTDDDCYINPVFGDTTTTNIYNNDKSRYLIEYPFFYQYQWANASLAVFTLESYYNNIWNQVANLNNNTNGTLFDFNSLCIPNWKGFELDWRKILINHGAGIYRFKVSSSIFASVTCLVSPPYCLKQFTCEAAEKTVKWDAYIFGGRLGSIDDDRRMFLFCCNKQQAGSDNPGVNTPVNWYDSVRHYGFFGYEKTEYQRVNYEWLDGTINQHKNEAIQSFEYHTAMLPKYLHDRFKAYGIMSDELYVSDYNWSNSDYDINKKLVVCDGGYDPSYTLVRGENATRLAPVKVQFKEGRQNVIRDKCCTPSLVSRGK